MVYFYKYGFFILLLILFVLLNTTRILTLKYEKEKDIINQKMNDRFLSLFSTNSILNRRVKFIKGTEVLTNKIELNILADTSIFILLDEADCNKCQENELIRLDSFNKKYNNGKAKIFGITTSNKSSTVIRQIKTNNISLPIYIVDKSMFYDKLAIDRKFPQILSVVNNIIVSAFKPLTFDDEFSQKYYDYVLKKIF